MFLDEENVKQEIKEIKEIIGERKIITAQIKKELMLKGYKEAEFNKNVKLERLNIVKKDIIIKIGLERKQGRFLLIPITKTKAFIKEII